MSIPICEVKQPYEVYVVGDFLDTFLGGFCDRDEAVEAANMWQDSDFVEVRDSNGKVVYRV